MSVNTTSNASEPIFLTKEKYKSKPFWKKTGFILFVLFSVVWIGLMWNYLASSEWWTLRYTLSPAELIGNISGLFLPLVILFLLTAYADRSAYLDEESQRLQSFLHELLYPTDEKAVYTQALTQTLREQIIEFRKIFDRVHQETESAQNELKKWATELNQLMKQADSQTNQSLQLIDSQIKNLSKVSEKANQDTARIADTFLNQADILAKVASQADDKMNSISNNYSIQTEALQHIITSFDASQNQTQDILKTAGVIKENMNLINQNMAKSIENYEKNMASHNDRLFGNLEKILSVFQKQGAILDNEIQKITNRMGVVSESLSDKTKGVIQEAYQATEKLNKIDVHFEESAQKVQKILSQIKEDVAHIQNDITESTQKATTVFPTAHQQAQADLLQDATLILDRLQSFSVDMAHIFTPKAEDSLWEKYHAGDKAVFMRHITKMLKTTQHKKILNLYETNNEFRLAVTRYMAEFEGMTKKAQEGEESKLLMSVLIGSDVGRLYMVLADVLKREE